MEIPSNYLEINRQAWNQRTVHHVNSPFYDLQGFLAGKSPLHSIETELLGDIKGKTLLHLQCHFGLDTLQLARMGAKVTGVDFSDESIAQAERIAATAGIPARFILSDIFSLPDVLDEQFDILFCTYGVIGWHPDMNAWAKILYKYLKPGGKLVFAEFHPVVWIFDNDFSKIAYSYFNQESITEIESGSYASEEGAFVQENISWNHDLGEVLGSLLSNKLQIKSFREYDYSPHNCMKNMVRIAEDRYQIKGMEGMIPLVYSLTAIKE